jgi:predicted Rossmann fold nucleotide-binding protein DprA/Smf involved in DNA uptake
LKNLKHLNLFELKRSLRPDSKLEELLLSDYTAGNVNILTLYDEDYPVALTQMSSPPVLYIKGSIPNNLIAAVVGTRNPTDPFIALNRRLVLKLTEKNVSVLSGLALGHDIIAHSHWLSLDIPNKPKPVVVLPFLNPVYPSSHSSIFEQLIEQGACVVAPIYDGSDANLKGSLIYRDSIQALLSHGVFPLEFGSTSGTLHCVSAALKHDVRLFSFKFPHYSQGVEILQTTQRQNVESFSKVFQDAYGKYKGSFPLSYAISKSDDLDMAIKFMRSYKTSLMLRKSVVEEPSFI